MFQAKLDFLKLCQNKNQSVVDYYEKYIPVKEVCETLEVKVHDDPGLVKIIAKEQGKNVVNLSAAEKEAMMDIGRERMMGIHLFMGSDRERYGSAINNFKHAYLMDKKNPYPKTLHDSYTLLKGWTRGGKHSTQTKWEYPSTPWATMMAPR
mmetsp:Transcript_44168/g.92862  ORF Transcript_44168/g.92862 Transcript_44168/m.92862 type:complete len:151 (-) Transcript_44168:248-700(-)